MHEIFQSSKPSKKYYSHLYYDVMKKLAIEDLYPAYFMWKLGFFVMIYQVLSLYFLFGIIPDQVKNHIYGTYKSYKRSYFLKTNPDAHFSSQYRILFIFIFFRYV